MLKVIRIIWTIIRTILTIILAILLAIIITQRVSDNKISAAGFRIFNVATESMVPDYLVGDAIFTKSVDPSEIKIGDDVTYLGTEDTFKDRIVTHRVVSIEKNEEGLYIFVTKGIANEKEDPKINETQIYGKVIYKIKSISYLNGIIGNLYGMYFAIFIPFGIIFFIEYVGYRKDREEDKKEEKEEKERKKEKKKQKDKPEEDDKSEKEELKIKENNNIDKEKEKRDRLKDRRKERRKKRRQKRHKN